MPVLLPLGLIISLLYPVINHRVLGRFGFGLRATVVSCKDKTQRFWFHALSLGEVASVVSLVKAVRKEYPESAIFFSTTTRSGQKHALSCLQDEVDSFVSFPLDHFLIVRYFIKIINPCCFILVETDFWPNFMVAIRRSGVKSLLVNGRVSIKSYNKYKRFNDTCLPTFTNFSCLVMQTELDARRMISLGVMPDKVKVLGNLKLDNDLNMVGNEEKTSLHMFEQSSSKKVLVFGSTHEKEEEYLCQMLTRLKPNHELFVIIAPRKVKRCTEVHDLFLDAGFKVKYRTSIDSVADCEVIVLDTIGELSSIYQFADVVFVGGSLVAQGGHNPLEPAVFAKPVCFGPRMEDFAELVDGLLANGAALQVNDVDELFEVINDLLVDNKKREQVGGAALKYVIKERGVTKQHLELLKIFVEGGNCERS